MTDLRPRLFTPGPVEVPPELIEAAGFMVHHRSALFRDEFARARRALGPFFGTEGDLAVLTSSGSGAMEAAVANFVSREDRVIVVRSGKYGERWGELSEAYGAAVDWIDIEPGASVRADEVGRRVDQSTARAVFLVHTETSTGALNDIKEVARGLDGRATLVVDVISSLGVQEIRMDEWGIDVAVGASQKGLGLPPGLGFVALGPRALGALDASTSPRYYFDLRKYVSSAERNETPFTAAVGLVAALRRGLDRIGPPGHHVRRHARSAHAVREGVRALGLDVFPDVPADALTVFRVPETLDAEELVRVLEHDHGIRIAHGQGELRGRVLRLGHLGWVEDRDLIELFEALEAGLAACRVRVERGVGVQAVRSALGGSRGRTGHGS